MNLTFLLFYTHNWYCFEDLWLKSFQRKRETPWEPHVFFMLEERRKIPWSLTESKSKMN